MPDIAELHSLYVIVIFLQTVPLQSIADIMHELDECFIFGKGTVWRDVTDTQHGRMLHKGDMSNTLMCYPGNVLYNLFSV